MPNTSSTQKGSSSQKGFQRIDKGLSGVSDRRSRGRAGEGAPLSLHIPNAHPRATSPRSAEPSPTPQIDRPPVHTQRISAASVSEALKGAHAHWSTERAERPSDDGAGRRRSSSGTPRVRVFRRDSSLITIHHVGDDDTDPTSVSPPRLDHGSRVQLNSTSFSGRLLQPLSKVQEFFATRNTSASSARDFLARERNFFVWLRLSCFLAILSASLVLQLQLPDHAQSSSPHRRRDHSRKRGPNEPVDWDHLPLSSKAFAGIFFVLSLLSLGTGLADYLSAERQLEKEQVDFDETEGVFLNDGHTSGFVHVVMVVVGTGIIASALWLLAY